MEMSMDDSKYFDERFTGLSNKIDAVNQNLSDKITQVANSFSAEITHAKELSEIQIGNVEEKTNNLRGDITDIYNRLGKQESETKAMKEITKSFEDKISSISVRTEKHEESLKGLDRRQSTDEGEATGKRSERENWFKRNGLALSIIGAIIAIAGFIFGVIK